MKNERYLDKAAERVNSRFTDTSIDQIKLLTLATYDECQAIAKEEGEFVKLDLENDILFDLAMKAHERDITLTEMIIICLERAIEENASLV